MSRSLNNRTTAAPPRGPPRRQGEIAGSGNSREAGADSADSAPPCFRALAESAVSAPPDSSAGRNRSNRPPQPPPALTFRGDDAPFRPPELRPSRPTIQDEPPMHAYRSHTCGALRLADAGSNVRLSGWVHRKRDHGGLLFVDLRDQYGLTQLVLHPP